MDKKSIKLSIQIETQPEDWSKSLGEEGREEAPQDINIIIISLRRHPSIILLIPPS